MKRKEFLKKTGCGMLCFSASPFLIDNASAQGVSEKRKRYKIDIEIFEAREDSWCPHHRIPCLGSHPEDHQAT